MYRAGEILGEYRLNERLGEGALGVVWEAQRVDSADRSGRAALKLLHLERVPKPVRASAFDQLTRALTAVGRLEHAGLQALQGTATRSQDGAFGLAARFYEGGQFSNLGNLARPGTLAQALGLLRQLVDTLAWLHERGITHGAVKPSNVLITPSPGGRRVVLLDLCWARAGLCRRTEASRVFVSPEQLAKQAGGPASDQWSSARLLHQLAVKASPGRSQTEALTALPVPVLRVLKRALEQDPRSRFASMESFSQALEHAQDELGVAGGSPNALPTPTLEVSTADAVAVTEDPTWRGRGVPLDEDETLQPDPVAGSEAPTPFGLATPTVRAQTPAPEPIPASALGVVRRPRPAEPEPVAADPSADRGDPTTPLSLKGINPSGDREGDRGEPRPSRAAPPRSLEGIDPSGDRSDEDDEPRPIRPGDPTDVLPSVAPADSGGGKGLLFALVAATALVAGGAYLYASMGPGTASGPVAIVATTTTDDPAPATTDAPPPDAQKAPPADPAKASPPPASPKAPPATKAPAAPKAPPPAKPVLASAKAAPPTPAPDPREAACERGRRSACLDLADAFRDGDGVPRSAAKARGYYARACGLRSIRACEAAGDLYARADPRRARRFFERACDAGRGGPCARLSAMWRAGDGGAANTRTADAFARRACEFGHTASCE